MIFIVCSNHIFIHQICSSPIPNISFFPFHCSSHNLLSPRSHPQNPSTTPFSMSYFNNWGNATDNPAANPLWPPNIYVPIPQVNFLDLLTSVYQHIYKLLPQVGYSMQVVGPVCGYSPKGVSSFLDQYLSHPRHRWPGSEDDLIVMFIVYPPHILAYLQRKKDLCVSEHQVRQYLWFHRMQSELKLMLGRTFEHDPVLFGIPEFLFPT